MSTLEQGHAGEDRAVALLQAAGLRVLERNYRCKAGELDAIALDRDTLVFVEVRTRDRADRGSALEAIGAAKQRQVARVAAHYLRERHVSQHKLRFDVVGITAGVATHVRDAFRLGIPVR